MFGLPTIKLEFSVWSGAAHFFPHAERIGYELSTVSSKPKLHNWNDPRTRSVEIKVNNGGPLDTRTGELDILGVVPSPTKFTGPSVSEMWICGQCWIVFYGTPRADTWQVRPFLASLITHCFNATTSPFAIGSLRLRSGGSLSRQLRGSPGA